MLLVLLMAHLIRYKNNLFAAWIVKMAPMLLLNALPFLVQAQPTLVNAGELTVQDGSILFIGGNTMQRDSAAIRLSGEIALTGDFMNDVTRGNVFATDSEYDGWFRFIGNTMQTIAGTAAKDTNYIAFPNVRIDKEDLYVAMVPSMGADMKKLDLKRGKLQLQADKMADDKEISFYNAHTPNRMAHLRVDEVTYNRDPALDPKQKGVVEVEMALPNNPDRINKMFGFVSPYKEMYADYFFANYLTAPDGNNLWGDSRSNVTSMKDPNIKLLAGHGYIVGQNILPESRYSLDPVWGDITALHNARINDKVVFNRYQLELDNNPIAGVISQADKYTVEELNTQNIVIELKKGWQFIGNPFTCPLDMGLILNTASHAYDPWMVARTPFDNMGIRFRYFVMAGGEGALDNWTPDRFTINPTWLVGQKMGSTVSREADNKFVIAPMQMVAIYANEDASITIPASQRTHAFTNERQFPSDELLLEVGDGTTFDRLALVFVTGANSDVTDIYDVTKTVDSLASPGQIFTQSAEGYAMITNMLSPTVKSIEMGMIPTLSERNMLLTAHRVATLSSVTQAWLEDRIAGGPWVDLKTTSGYAFISKPDDRIDRFVIHINVAANSQLVEAQPLPENLFHYQGIPAATPIASNSTGPVGSVETNETITLTTDLICEGSDAKITVDPSLVNVMYNVYDDVKSGNLKGNAAGTGSKLVVDAGTYSQQSPKHYYVNARSTDGLITIIRRLPIGLQLIPQFVYPDIRLKVCPKIGQDIILSKYLDTAYFKSVVWKKLVGENPLVGDVLRATPNNFESHVLEYTVTDLCRTAEPAKMYITTMKNDPIRKDTVVACYDVAEAVQLNQIFGIEAGGTIVPETPGLIPGYFKVSAAPQVFAGAATFSGKEAYLQNGLLPDAPSKYGAGAKIAVFKYIPSAGSCMPKSEYKLAIILTPMIK